MTHNLDKVFSHFNLFAHLIQITRAELHRVLAQIYSRRLRESSSQWHFMSMAFEVIFKVNIVQQELEVFESKSSQSLVILAFITEPYRLFMDIQVTSPNAIQ